MPTPYILKLHRDLKIPVKTLEEYWDKAKSISEGRGLDKSQKAYWAYTMRIFNNMLGISKSVSISKEELPHWWRKKTDEFRAAYIKQHPRSKFIDSIPPAEVKKLEKIAEQQEQQPEQVEKPESTVEDSAPAEKEAQQQESKPSDADTQTDEGEDGEGEEADSKPESNERAKYKHAKLANVARKSYTAARASLEASLREAKDDMKIMGTSMRNAIGGDGADTLTPEEDEKAKEISGKIAKMVISSIVGVAMFTPLAGIALESGHHFYDLWKNRNRRKGEDRRNGVDEDDDEADWGDDMGAAQHVEGDYGPDKSSIVSTPVDADEDAVEDVDQVDDEPQRDEPASTQPAETQTDEEDELDPYGKNSPPEDEPVDQEPIKYREQDVHEERNLRAGMDYADAFADWVTSAPPEEIKRQIEDAKTPEKFEGDEDEDEDDDMDFSKFDVDFNEFDKDEE